MNCKSLGAGESLYARPEWCSGRHCISGAPDSGYTFHSTHSGTHDNILGRPQEKCTIFFLYLQSEVPQVRKPSVKDFEKSQCLKHWLFAKSLKNFENFQNFQNFLEPHQKTFFDKSFYFFWSNFFQKVFPPRPPQDLKLTRQGDSWKAPKSSLANPRYQTHFRRNLLQLCWGQSYTKQSSIGYFIRFWWDWGISKNHISKIFGNDFQ